MRRSGWSLPSDDDDLAHYAHFLQSVGHLLVDLLVKRRELASLIGDGLMGCGRGLDGDAEVVRGG